MMNVTARTKFTRPLEAIRSQTVLTCFFGENHVKVSLIALM